MAVAVCQGTYHGPGPPDRKVAVSWPELVKLDESGSTTLSDVLATLLSSWSAQAA